MVVDHLEHHIKKENQAAACVYVYFNDAVANEQDAVKLFANILMQLVQQQKADRTAGEVKKLETLPGRVSYISFEEWIHLVNAEVELFATVFLVIDALNECQDNLDNSARQVFLKGILQLGWKVKILVTSRPASALERKFSADQQLKIETDPADLKLYVLSRIRQNEDIQKYLEKLERGPNSSSVVDTVIQKAQGTWVTSSTRGLNSRNLTIKQILKRKDLYGPPCQPRHSEGLQICLR